MSDSAIAAPETRLQNFLERAGLRGFPWIPAIVLYTISWGWLFIVRNSYWADDWDLFKFQSLEPVHDFKSLGYPPWTKINLLLFDSFGPAMMRLLIFVCFFASSIFVFGITSKIQILKLSQRKFLVLLFILLPFNTARITLMTFHSTTALLMFFAAWYFAIGTKSTSTKTMSLILFFLSFQTFTLVVFFILPVLHLLWLANSMKLKELTNLARKNLVLIGLPFLFWVARNIFWPSSTQYHSLTQNKINSALVFVISSILLLLLLFYLRSRLLNALREPFSIFLIGFFAAFLGIVVYVFYGLVGYRTAIPTTYLITLFGRSDWISRHQILQPLGVGLMIVGLLGLLPSFMRKATQKFQIFIIAFCVIFNVCFGFEYVVDYDKQVAIVGQLKVSNDREVVTDLQIIDQTTFLNARQRSYRERDWLGLVALASGIDVARKTSITGECSLLESSRMVLIEGPKTHWQALKNWVGNGDMGFEVTVDDTPGACRAEVVTIDRSSGAIPILFYFTGARN